MLHARVWISIVVATAAACGGDDTSFQVTLGPDEPAAVTAASRLSFAVYGHDAFVADAAATLILEGIEPVAALPLTLELALPADPHTLIDQGFGPVARADARFYLSRIYVDLDGDGQICATDLSQKFDDGGPIDFDLDGPIGPFMIPLQVWGQPCRPFPN